MNGSDSDLCLDLAEDGVAFWIHVTPRARRDRVGPLHGDALRVSVKAPAVEGKANAACAVLIARALSLTRSAVAIDPASRGRRKRVRVAGDTAELQQRLHALASVATQL